MKSAAFSKQQNFSRTSTVFLLVFCSGISVKEQISLPSVEMHPGASVLFLLTFYHLIMQYVLHL